MAVVISRTLRPILGDAPSQELAQKFYDYKVSGNESFGALFGRDKKHDRPREAVSRQLWHVHMENGSSAASWDYISENFYERNFTQDNFTSDTILVYAYAPTAPKAPYFLLAVLDPDGHDLMEDAELMKGICHMYDKELQDYRSKMPCNDWIIVQ